MEAPHEHTGLLYDTTFWLWGSFLIFLFILWKMGKAAFVNMLDGKIAKIRDEIETAETLRTEAQELLAQYERKHRDALQESEAIVATAKKSADQIRAKAGEDLKEMMARKEKQLNERLTRMKQSAIDEIQQYAANLAIEATKEIIANQVDKKAQDKLLEASIKDVSSNIH